MSPLNRQLNKSGEENWPDPIFPYFPEPHNAISETDWQKLWQNAENSAGHNKLDPNGSEVTDPPGYEESEVSTDLLMGTGADRRAANRLEDEQSPACSRSIDVMCVCAVACRAITGKFRCIIINGHILPHSRFNGQQRVCLSACLAASVHLSRCESSADDNAGLLVGWLWSMLGH